MVIDVEVSIIGLNLVNTEVLQAPSAKLLIDQFEAFFNSLWVLCLICSSTLKVVKDRQNSSYSLLTSVENQFLTSPQCTFRSSQIRQPNDILVFPLLSASFCAATNGRVLPLAVVSSPLHLPPVPQPVLGCFFVIQLQLFAFNLYIFLFITHNFIALFVMAYLAKKVMF